MTEAPVLQAFPRRRIALARTGGKARRWCLIIGLPALLAAAYVGYAAWQRTSLRADLNERGLPAEIESAEGSCTSRRGVTLGCSYAVRYRIQANGEVREGSIYVPGSGPRVFAPPVRYDPQDPSRIMSEADLERGEPVMNVVMPIGIFGVIATLWVLAWYGLGNRRLAKAAASPRPVLVPVTRSAPRPGTKFTDVWYLRADGSEAQQPVFDSEPLYVQPPPGAPAGQYPALALLAPDGQPILLTKDLQELALTGEERTTILAAARQG